MLGGRRSLALIAATIAIAALPVGAATDKELRAVRGPSGYRVTLDAPFQRVFGRMPLADDAFAVTQAAANALVILPDSSEVALGPNTNVRVGAFNDATLPTPTTITLENGTLRFDVRHPAGGRANYRFTTTTSQIAVRGTIGLYATGPNGDVVSCLECANGDVVVTVGTQTFALTTGETLFISLAGAVTAAGGTAAVSQAFAGTGLTTQASAATPFTASIGSSAAASSAAIPASIIAPAAGAAAIGIGASAIANGNHGTGAVPAPLVTPTPQPAVTPTPQPIVTPTPHPAPVATPTPSSGTGNATLTGLPRRHP
jgi:hypothetical protein